MLLHYMRLKSLPALEPADLPMACREFLAATLMLVARARVTDEQSAPRRLVRAPTSSLSKKEISCFSKAPKSSPLYSTGTDVQRVVSGFAKVGGRGCRSPAQTGHPKASLQARHQHSALEDGLACSVLKATNRQ